MRFRAANPALKHIARLKRVKMTRLTPRRNGSFLLALLGKGFGRPTQTGFFRLAWKMQYRGKPQEQKNAMKRNSRPYLAL